MLARSRLRDGVKRCAQARRNAATCSERSERYPVRWATSATAMPGAARFRAGPNRAAHAVVGRCQSIAGAQGSCQPGRPGSVRCHCWAGCCAGRCARCAGGARRAGAGEPGLQQQGGSMEEKRQRAALLQKHGPGIAARGCRGKCGRTAARWCTTPTRHVRCQAPGTNCQGDSKSCRVARGESRAAFALGSRGPRHLQVQRSRRVPAESWNGHWLWLPGGAVAPQ